MYELFVLGLLLDRPMHGYLLHQIISVAIGPTRQMSWGALYPLIRRLEEEGAIEHDETACSAYGGHQRKIYRLTEVGKQRFQWAIMSPAAYNSDYPDLFTIKLGLFRHIGPPDQLTILRHHQGYLQFVRDYLQANRQRIHAHLDIPDLHRTHILRAIDQRLGLVQCDSRWVEEQIAQVGAQLEGMERRAGTAEPGRTV